MAGQAERHGATALGAAVTTGEAGPGHKAAHSRHGEEEGLEGRSRGAAGHACWVGRGATGRQAGHNSLVEARVVERPVDDDGGRGRPYVSGRRPLRHGSDRCRPA